jgi:ketosteroid isomerase-like protein
MTDIRGAIGAVNSEFMADFNRGDLASVAQFYTEDAQLLAPNHEPFAGRGTIAAVLGGLRGDGGSLRLETLEAEAQGDMAWEQGRYTLSGADGAERDRGKYLVIWKQVNGQWRLHRDMLSTSLPAA